MLCPWRNRTKVVCIKEHERCQCASTKASEKEGWHRWERERSQNNICLIKNSVLKRQRRRHFFRQILIATHVQHFITFSVSLCLNSFFFFFSFHHYTFTIDNHHCHTFLSTENILYLLLLPLNFRFHLPYFSLLLSYFYIKFIFFLFFLFFTFLLLLPSPFFWLTF